MKILIIVAIALGITLMGITLIGRVAQPRYHVVTCHLRSGGTLPETVGPGMPNQCDGWTSG